MAQMNISNTLFNDTQAGIIAYVEQLKDRLLKNYIATLSQKDQGRIPANIKSELGVLQERLNEFFIKHWVDYQSFLLDEGVDPETIDSWHEVQEFLKGLPDDEAMWLKNQIARLDNRINNIDIPDGGAFDISTYNSTEQGVLAQYATLEDAILAIPSDHKKSGMTIRFLSSVSGEYEQYRYVYKFEDTQAGNASFNNPDNWRGIDDIPTERSENTVKSGGVYDVVTTLHNGLLDGDLVPAMAETLAPWADQKAIATPDTYTDAVRTTGGDIPIETSAGSKLESIKPVAGSKWTAKMLFNGSYNMLNAVTWGHANNQTFVGDWGGDFVYFLVPKLTLGTFGTADENNGLLFTDYEGVNVEPTSVYFKPLGSIVPQSLTDGTELTLQTDDEAMGKHEVNYDGKRYMSYTNDGAGWLIIPRSYYDSDICAHISWEDWYDKYVSLDELETNPEAVIGALILDGLLALVHSDKYLRGVNEEICDNVVFGDTSATITHMVDELSVAANAWTNSATGESDSQGNALYRHSATVSGIKNGGAACVEGNDGGIPLTVNGTTVSYIDTNAAAPASVVFYEVTTTSTTKAYTDSIFNGSNINQETGVLPINDCSIEAQVAMDGKANITVKYAKNIVDQVAINATVDVPQIKRQVENHEERIGELEDTAVRTNSYDASVAVGLADNFKGDTVVNAEFYKRKTGGTQSVGSGIAAIKEVRGKSLVWNQLFRNPSLSDGGNNPRGFTPRYGTTFDNSNADYLEIIGLNGCYMPFNAVSGHKYYIRFEAKRKTASDNDKTYFYCPFVNTVLYHIPTDGSWYNFKNILTASNDASTENDAPRFITRTNVLLNKQEGFTIYDLTLMFGAGNEPTTVAEFEKMFPLDYYDYNEGEVIPFAGQNLTTTGKNQYNPVSGKANLLGGQTYQIGGTYTSAEIDGVAVTLDSNNCFTTTKDCILDVTGGNDTDTIVALYNGENVTFEPYEKHTLPLDPSQWRDKQGNLVFPYGGMHGVDSVYDYAKVDADGYIRKAVRGFGRVYLKNLNWNYTAVGQYTPHGEFYASINNIKPSILGIVDAFKARCNVYKTYPTTANFVVLAAIDKLCFMAIGGGHQGKKVFITDSSYTSVTDFVAHFKDNDCLVYQLETPVEVELATPVYAKYLVDKDGTEEITPANGTTPYTTMANLSILYAMDARGEIKNLPKNYISEGSIDNLLTQLNTATNGTWTKTWNASTQEWGFTFIPNPEPEESNT